MILFPAILCQLTRKQKCHYEYNIKDAATLSFELCATFNESSSQEKLVNSPPVYPAGSGINQNWDHMSDRVCFERTIDKQLYPLLPIK